MADEVPDVPGFAELWGGAVFHCPFCHGWEVRDRPVVVYGAG
jgi:thioredoxin reductase